MFASRNSVFCGKQTTAFTPTLTTITTAGAYTYTIPTGCTKVDVILLGDGAGSGGGGPGCVAGQAGTFATATLTVGTTITGSTITGTVGAGGAAGGVYTGGGAGGGTTAAGTGWAGLSASGGVEVTDGSRAPGKGAGTQVFNGRSYVGGGPTTTQPQSGNVPGGGASAGAYGVFEGGNAGAVGAAWFYAY